MIVDDDVCSNGGGDNDDYDVNVVMMLMVKGALPYIDITGELDGVAVWQIPLVACKTCMIML